MASYPTNMATLELYVIVIKIYGTYFLKITQSTHFPFESFESSSIYFVEQSLKSVA